jgi:hypothetical protein
MKINSKSSKYFKKLKNKKIKLKKIMQKKKEMRKMKNKKKEVISLLKKICCTHVSSSNLVVNNMMTPGDLHDR